MSRIVYLNGAWLPEKEAKLSVFDRATLFADAVYEVCCFIDGRFLDFDGHMKRLQNSLKALDIRFTVEADALLHLHREIIEKNGLANGIVYLQVSRGAADRNFHYDNDVSPTFFMFTQPDTKEALETIKTYKVISYAEGRWARRDIKTTQLLYSSLAKTKAHDSGVDDAIYVEDGYITEATSANFHIIDQNGVFITRPLDGTVLPGITRASLLMLARENGIKVEERLFTLDEVFAAKEAFLSSASGFVRPVVAVDGRTIGNGEAGDVSRRLFALYLEKAPRY